MAAHAAVLTAMATSSEAPCCGGKSLESRDFIIGSGRVGSGVSESGTHALDERFYLRIPDRKGHRDNSHAYEQQNQRLAPVLPHQAAEKRRLARDVGARGIVFVADD